MNDAFRPSDDADYVRPESSPPKLTEIQGDAWAQQPTENALWYERFVQYLKLGPTRSVSLAATGRRNAYPLPSHWMVVSRDYRWKERATLWDAAGSPKPAPAKDIARRAVRAKPRTPVMVVEASEPTKNGNGNDRRPVDDGLPTEDGTESTIASEARDDGLVELNEVTGAAIDSDDE